MRFLTVCASLFGVALMMIVSAGSANAQATRTWVSGVGDDANPCSRTAPCKTFAGAISKTATAGEINVLDPGGFGALTITKAITIRSDHIEAGVLVSGTNGITVNAPAGAAVILQGLDFQGVGTGLNGVSIISASKVTIQNCLISGFTQNGVNIAGPAGTHVLIADSIITGNTGNGVGVAGVSGVANVVLVMRSLIDNNGGSSINIAAGSTLQISDSKLLGSASSVTNAGTFVSYGDNVFQITATPTSTPGLH